MEPDSLDILAKLRLTALHRPDSSNVQTKNGNPLDFYFRLNVSSSRAAVETVDSKGKPVNPDPKGQPGDIRLALMSLQGAPEGFDFEWVKGTKAGVDSKSLDQNPLVMFNLVHCPNLVDKNMKPLAVSEVKGHLTLEVAADDKNPENLRASLVLECGDERYGGFHFLTDSFVLVDDRIMEIESVGANYRQIKAFLEPFRKDTLEPFFSVFLTYFTGIKIAFGTLPVKYVQDPVKTIPTLSIEKIDVDKALHIRLLDSVPGESDRLLESVPVDYDVSIGQSRILVRPIKHIQLHDTAADLLRRIKACAEGRTAKNDVYYDDKGLFIIPEETASAFLLQSLTGLARDFRIVGLSKLNGYKLRPIKPRLSVRFSSGINYLEGPAEVEIDGRKMSLQNLLDQYRRKRYIELPGDQKGIVDEEYIKRLERIFHERQGDNVKVSFFDLPEIEGLLSDVELNAEALRRPREFYAGFNKLSRRKLATPGVNAELRPYQKEGVKWLRYLYDNNLGGCLADDMGLGKTLQIITLLSEIYPKQKKPTLIVMPRSLLFNWQSEFKKFAPQIDVHTYYGPDRNLDESLRHSVILSTYAVVRNDIENLRKTKFHMVILDESQTIKNIQAQQTRSVYLLQADKRFALSGTPIENNLSELYSLFRFLNPSMFGSLEDFNTRFGNPIQRDDDKEAKASLRRIIFPFMLRRLKRDVLKDLPERIDETIYIDMDADQEKLYHERRLEYSRRIEEAIAEQGVQKAQFIMLQALNDLRQIASIPEKASNGRVKSPKLEALVESIENAVGNGHKVVAFFNFIAGIDIVAAQLSAKGIGFATMTGATDNRAEVVERFQNDSDCSVFLMTLKTGGVGLNLTVADIVYIVEPWWNKAAEQQAVNRLHRIGQKSTVMSFSLITHDTIEEKIQQLQQRKAELFDSVIASDSSSSKQLSEEDIRFILS